MISPALRAALAALEHRWRNAVLSEIRLRYDFARDAWTAVLEGIRSNARDSVRHQRIFVAKFRVDDKRLPDLADAVRRLSPIPVEQYLSEWNSDLQAKLERYQQGGPEEFRRQLGLLERREQELADQAACTSKRIFVCSDVHLGIGNADEEGFRALLDQCDDDALILLGDVLDFWVDESDEDTRLAYVKGHWNNLYTWLSALKARTRTRIHYVPGNHDCFAFLLEAGDALTWTRIVLARCPALEALRTETRNARFTKLVDVHYPFLRQELTPTSNSDPQAAAALKHVILLTHGHAHVWGWQLFDGYGDPMGWTWGFVTLLSAGLAHKYANAFRRVAKIAESGFGFGKRAQDIAAPITNTMVNAFVFAGRRIENEPEAFAEVLETAIRIYCEEQGVAQETVAGIKVRKAMEQLKEHAEDRTLKGAFLGTREYLQRAASSMSYTLSYDSPADIVKITPTPFARFQLFDKFVCGHFHKARAETVQGVECYEAGCFLFDGEHTYLQINPDGRIFHPAD